VVSILEEYPDYKLKMGGHTDANGTNAANLRLSQQRVDAVKVYLVDKGVGEDRLEATGFGEEQPVESNRTVNGRALNRRVTLELILK
jgi:OOP family OmpA-OmpF porin